MGAVDWEERYEQLAPLHKRLAEEVLFAVGAELTAASIKVHSTTGRVKSLASLTEKAQRKGYLNPLEQATDLVGVRVVVLFLSDISRVETLLRNLFTISQTQDHIEGGDDPQTFGYMSRHFEGSLRSEHAGPRYDDLRGFRFEIQLRTLLMDAWANVSHYLAYKGESSIPEELRRDFYALSGLFYVADKHFETFLGTAAAVQSEASSRLDDSDEAVVDLNLETLAAFLERRFPDREHGSRASVAQLVDDLLRFGHSVLSDVEELLSSQADAFAVEERDDPPREGGTPTRFTDVGVVRRSLVHARPEYADYMVNRHEVVDEEEQ